MNIINVPHVETIDDKYYLSPALTLFGTLDNLKKNKEGRTVRLISLKDNVLDFSPINGMRLVLLLAEPGCGKSEFVKQLFISTPSSKIIVDCKDLKDQAVDKFLLALPDKNELPDCILLDALDEVDLSFQLAVVKNIVKFFEAYPNIRVVVTCRLHYMSKFGAYFSKITSLQYIKINLFDGYDVKAYLSHFSIGESSQIEDLLIKLNNGTAGEVFRTPRYLKAFVVAHRQGNFQGIELTAIKRKDIFEKVIYYKLESEVKTKLGDASPNEIEITKRVLEKLALVMEIYQTNRITKEELVTFLDETVSNINLVFLNYSSIDVFIDRVLKTTDYFHEFGHTQFQEYLAAKQLVRMANKEQALYDLILDPDLQQVYPSWYDVIIYAAEMNPAIILNLTSYLSLKEKFQVDQKLIDIIISVDEKELTDTQKSFLFETLYNYYQKSGEYLVNRFVDVSKFFSPIHNTDYLTIDTEESVDRRFFTNRILVIAGINFLGKLSTSDKDNWIQLLINRASDKAFAQVHENIFYVLESFKAFDQLLQIKPAILLLDQGSIDSYLLTLFKIDSNDPRTIDLLLELIQDHQFLSSIPGCADMLSNKASIKKLLNFLTDELNLNKFLNHNDSFENFTGLFRGISEHSDQQIESSLREILEHLIKGEYLNLYGLNRNFADEIFKHLMVTDSNFLVEILARDPEFHLIRGFSDSIAAAMTMAEFDILYKRLVADRRAFQLNRIASHLAVIGNDDRRLLYKNIKAKYPDLYPEYTAEEIVPLQTEEDKKMLEFREKLDWPIDSEKNNDLFTLYLHNKSLITQFATKEEIEKLKSRLTDIINNIKPENYRVYIHRWGTGTNFNVQESHFFRLEFLYKVAIALNMDDLLKANRLKMILYLPQLSDYMENVTSLKAMIEYLQPITQEEIQQMVDFSIGRSDDFIYASINTFIDLISELKLESFIPVLHNFIADDTGKTDQHEKGRAMDCYGLIAPKTDETRNYLQSIFDLHNIPNGNAYLRQLANGYLISIFEDIHAIDWRFDQMKKNKVPKKPKVAHSGFQSYPASEYEMDKPTYHKCFIRNPTSAVVSRMFDLLEFSFEIRKDIEYARYSSYLQQMIYEVMNEVKNIRIINQLKALRANDQHHDTSLSFNYYLRKLEVDFVTSFPANKSMAEAIIFYNELNKKLYLKVRDEADLAQLLEAVLENEVKNVIENEGFYHIDQRLSGQIKHKQSSHIDEDLIQRTLSFIINNALLSRGLRSTDIYREVELLDAKRYDYLLKYGFIGPIVFELKRADNAEIANPAKRLAYKEKIKQYINAVKCNHAFYLVFQVLIDGADTQKKNFDLLVDEYKDIKGLNIRYIDCTAIASAENLVVSTAVKAISPKKKTTKKSRVKKAVTTQKGT